MGCRPKFSFFCYALPLVISFSPCKALLVWAVCNSHLSEGHHLGHALWWLLRRWVIIHFHGSRNGGLVVIYGVDLEGMSG